jgi:hypothetical protein
MKILAAKNAKGANDVQKNFFDIVMCVYETLVFSNKGFSSRLFACFAAKKVCLL